MAAKGKQVANSTLDQSTDLISTFIQSTDNEYFGPNTLNIPSVHTSTFFQNTDLQSGSTADPLGNTDDLNDPNMPELSDSEDELNQDGIFTSSSYDDELDITNLESVDDVPPTPSLKAVKDHPSSQIIGDKSTGVQTRSRVKGTSSQHQAFLSFMYKQNRTNHKDHQTCLFACFISQEEPKKVSQALADEN